MQKLDIFLYFTFTNSISYMTEELSGTSPTDLPPELQNTKPSISKANKVFIQKFSGGVRKKKKRKKKKFSGGMCIQQKRTRCQNAYSMEGGTVTFLFSPTRIPTINYGIITYNPNSNDLEKKTSSEVVTTNTNIPSTNNFSSTLISTMYSIIIYIKKFNM